MRLLCSWMCRAHCHRVIKLSGTLQVLAPEKELVENVHGVRRAFLESGEALSGIALAVATCSFKRMPRVEYVDL